MWPKGLIQAFNALVAPANQNGCRLWLGPVHGGYGYFHFKKKRYWAAHKLALCIRTKKSYVHGKELQAAHDCPGEDNKLCVEHVSWKTMADHFAERYSKGQHARGKKHGAHTKPETVRRGLKHSGTKVTPALAKEIRQRYAKEKITQAQLGKLYGISEFTVYNILHRKTWMDKKGIKG